jgi:superfamily I DNA/RNA helicase
MATLDAAKTAMMLAMANGLQINNEKEVSPEEIELLTDCDPATAKTVAQAIDMGLRSDSYTFTDMVWQPPALSMSPYALTFGDTKRGLYKPTHIILDECQDVSLTMLMTLKKFAPEAALIAAGDPRQSIMQFMGATNNYARRAEELFGPITVLHLNESFRLPKVISEQLLGGMRIISSENNGEGVYVEGVSYRDIMPEKGDFVIAEKWAILVGLAFYWALRKRIPVQLGKDFSLPQVSNVIREVGQEKPIHSIAGIAEIQAKQDIAVLVSSGLPRAVIRHETEKIQDRVRMLVGIAANAQELTGAEVIRVLESMRDPNGALLGTPWTVKGRECHTAYVYGKGIIADARMADSGEQSHCTAYVAITRPRERLVLFS